MGNFNPIKAKSTLNSNGAAIKLLGDEIEKKHLAYILAKAKLADAEQVARISIFEDKEPVKVSEIRDWMKWKTAKELKEHDQLEQELRLLKQKLEILIEVNNATKAAYKISELEAKNMI